MASMKHDGIVSLFRNRPALAAELLQGPLGLALPAWSEARLEPSDFTQVAPTEHRADLAVLLSNGKPVFATVVEVQLSRDYDKHVSWPVYLINLRARVRCPTVLLVVTPDPAVARWCAQPIELDHPGFVLQPLVAGPSTIPIILGPQAAGQNPELAVLSTLAHGHDARLAPALIEAVVSSARGLDTERYSFYVDLALSALGETARRALEAMMQSGTYQYQSELVRKLVGQGREEGREEGQQEGRLDGERSALIKVLEARGLAVDGGARKRLLACTELAQIDLWLSQAATVQSVQQLFKHKLASKLAVRKAGPLGRHRKAPKPSTKR
jgi:hypothetical protein